MNDTAFTWAICGPFIAVCLATIIGWIAYNKRREIRERREEEVLDEERERGYIHVMVPRTVIEPPKKPGSYCYTFFGINFFIKKPGKVQDKGSFVLAMKPPVADYEANTCVR